MNMVKLVKLLKPAPWAHPVPRTLPAPLPVPVHAMLVAQRCMGGPWGSFY